MLSSYTVIKNENGCLPLQPDTSYVRVGTPQLSQRGDEKSLLIGNARYSAGGSYCGSYLLGPYRARLFIWSERSHFTLKETKIKGDGCLLKVTQRVGAGT